MPDNEQATLLTGRIGPHLLRLAAPAILGLASVFIFFLVDAYFIGLLGDHALAAIGYAFPVINLFDGVVIGLGIGIASVVSRRYGESGLQAARDIALIILLMATVLGVLASIIGIIFGRELFQILGADDTIIPTILEYMIPAFIGSGILYLPLTANALLRGLGDLFIPSIILFGAMVTNCLLDPLLIFGWGIIPSYGIAGAAYATIISRIISTVVVFYYMIRKYNIYHAKLPDFALIKKVLVGIGFIFIPATIANAITPLATGVVTRILSEFGNSAVAAYGVALRIELLAWVPFFALAIGSVPYMGQNWGANQYQRIQKGIIYTTKLCLIWAATLVVLLYFGRYIIAAGFTQATEIQDIIALYLTIVPIGYFGAGLVQISSAKLNATGHPLRAVMIPIVQFFLLYLPVAYAMKGTFGIKGIFFGALIAHFAAGIVALLVVRRTLKPHLS